MISINIATNLIVLHLNLLANIFDRTSQGEWVHESHDQKYTAHLCVLSRPALHLVKACLSKPIWAYHCAPREDKQGPHAFIYEKHLAEAIVLCKRKKKIRPQVHLSHVTCFNVFISSLVSNKSAGREQQNVVCARMMCQNWNDNRNHVTALPEMTFHYISMTHCLYYNNVTWPAWQN